MSKEFTCELDGLVMHGESDDELVAHVERHIAEAHAHLVGQLSRDDIRAKVASESRTTDSAGSGPALR
jgi:predicted small metal-binding protein